eukprot:scaffold6143_cov66-Skeletonema_marinoi.AAC.2
MISEGGTTSLRVCRHKYNTESWQQQAKRMTKSRKTKIIATVPPWDDIWAWISAEFKEVQLCDEKVKELGSKVVWDKLEMKHRITINIDFFTTGESARSSSFSDSIGTAAPDHIHDVVERCINYPADDTKPAAKPAAKPVAAAPAPVIDLCASSGSDNDTTINPTSAFTRVASKKSNDRRGTSDTNKTLKSLSSFVQHVGKSVQHVGKNGKAILEALKCPNSSTKRDKRSSPEDRVPTYIIRQETGAKNVNTKKAREEDSDGGDENNPDTNVSVDVKTVAAEEAGGDPSMLPEEVDLDMEKKFAYEDDEENTSPPLPQDNVGAVSKLSAPPKDLMCVDIPALVQGMKGLDLRMPYVNKKHLSHPKGQNVSKLRSIRAVWARGHQYHDDSHYRLMGYSAEDAKRIAYIEDWNVRLGSHFKILRDDENGVLNGVQCKSCKTVLEAILRKSFNNISDYMKDHIHRDCKEKCPSCGLSASTLDNDHKKWRYEEFYIKRLCKGEEPLDFEEFIAAAQQFKNSWGQDPFFPDGNTLLVLHTRQNKRLDKSMCALWHQHATWFKDYVEEYGTDVIEKKNVATFGKTDKEIRSMRAWVDHQYVPNEYGGFGEYKQNAFTGNRRAIVQSIHELVRQKQTEGMKPLTSFFSKK